MIGKDAQIVTQRQFLRYVEDMAAPVSYVWPGRFQADRLEVRISMAGARLGTFLGKLGKVMTFDAYDQLSRAVWVANMAAEEKAEAFDKAGFLSPPEL